MRIVTLNRLPPRLDASRAQAQTAAFGGYLSRAAIAAYARQTRSYSEYLGLFAVESNQVLGQLFVFRLPYTFASGVETVAGIASVTTRADAAQRGVARSLLEEAHRREQAAGVRYAMLWTSPSWYAHHLYEELGYRDVFHAEWAVRIPTRPPRVPRSWTVRPARRAEYRELETIHRRYGKGRLGFTPRPHQSLRAEADVGFLTPDHLLVAKRGPKIRGYAYLDSDGPHTVQCGELVADSSEAAEVLITAVEAHARRTPVVFANTLVRDFRELLDQRGYLMRPVEWRTLMGVRFGALTTSEQAVREFSTSDPRFLCLAGDRF